MEIKVLLLPVDLFHIFCFYTALLGEPVRLSQECENTVASSRDVDPADTQDWPLVAASGLL